MPEKYRKNKKWITLFFILRYPHKILNNSTFTVFSHDNLLIFLHLNSRYFVNNGQQTDQHFSTTSLQPENNRLLLLIFIRFCSFVVKKKLQANILKINILYTICRFVENFSAFSFYVIFPDLIFLFCIFPIFRWLAFTAILYQTTTFIIFPLHFKRSVHILQFFRPFRF